MNAPSPDLIPASRWRAIALVLAVACAALSGLLFLAVAEPPRSAAADAGASDAAAAPEEEVDAGAAPVRRGRIEGVIQLSGTPPVMRVAAQRKDAEFCKFRLVPSNAIVVKDGRLKDVLVRIENGGVKSEYSLPETRVVLDHRDCLYTPRIQGAMVGQELELQNRDPTFHNTHGYIGNESWASLPQPKGGAAAVRMFEASGIYKFNCDVHPWERAFVVVSDHPFFAVSGEDGSFAIPDVPAGRYMIEAWHARYGLRRIPAEVGDTPAVVKVTFETTDPEPEINRGEYREPF
jgi:plastocyanin